MGLKLHTFLGEDLQNSGWTTFIGNNLSRPYQYAFGGKKVEVIDSQSLAEVKTAWNDFNDRRIVNGLVKTAAIIVLLIPALLLTICLKGLSILLTSKSSEEVKSATNTNESDTSVPNEENHAPVSDNAISNTPSPITGKTGLLENLSHITQFPIISAAEENVFITTNIAKDWFSVVLLNLPSIQADRPLFIVAPQNAAVPTPDMLNNEDLRKFPKVIFSNLPSLDDVKVVESDKEALNDSSDTKLFLVMPTVIEANQEEKIAPQNITITLANTQDLTSKLTVAFQTIINNPNPNAAVIIEFPLCTGQKIS